VKIAGIGSEREIPIEEFFVDVGRTAVKAHEIVTEVIVPPVALGSRTAFMKLSKTAEDIAKVNAAVALTMADGCARMPRSRSDRSHPLLFGPASRGAAGG